MIVTRAHACNCAVCGYAILPGTKAVETNGGLAHQICVPMLAYIEEVVPFTEEDFRKASAFFKQQRGPWIRQIEAAE